MKRAPDDASPTKTLMLTAKGAGRRTGIDPPKKIIELATPQRP